MMQAIRCTVSPAVALSAEDRGPGEDSSGCHVIDVSMHKPFPERIRTIRFKNSYTHSITVLYKKEGVAKWRPCIVDYVLMSSCHVDEKGAGQWVEFTESHFMTKLDSVSNLRLVLKQPSPHWKHWGIQQLECYHDNRPHPSRTNYHTHSKTELPYEVNLLAYT